MIWIYSPENPARMTGGRRRWGGSTEYRTAKEQYQYLLQCAKDWDAGVCHSSVCPEMGRKVRKMAKRFADRHNISTN